MHCILNLTTSLAEKSDIPTIFLSSGLTFVTSKMSRTALQMCYHLFNLIPLRPPSQTLLPWLQPRYRISLAWKPAQSPSPQCHQVPMAKNSNAILLNTATGLPRLVVPSTYQPLPFNNPGILVSLWLVSALCLAIQD